MLSKGWHEPFLEGDKGVRHRTRTSFTGCPWHSYTTVDWLLQKKKKTLIYLFALEQQGAWSPVFLPLLFSSLPLFPYLVRPSLLSVAVIKTMTKAGGLCGLHIQVSVHHKVRTGIEGKNWSRGHRGVLLTGLLTIAPSVCFLTQPRNTGKGSITHSGLGPLSLQSLTKKITCPHINLMEVFFFSWEPLPTWP